MSIRTFAREHCPKSILPYLLAVHRILRNPLVKHRARKNSAGISARASQYLPKYQDELSREILSDRLEFLRTQDKNIFLDRAEKSGMKFRELPYSSGKEYSGIVLLYDNEGSDFRYTQRLLSSGGLPYKYRLMTLKDFLNGAEVSDSELIVLALTYWGEAKFFSRIAAGNLKAEVWDSLYSIREDLQYFDVFSPVENEIVIDAGAYDGATAVQFLSWGGGKVKKIYSFEFDPENAAKCRENLKQYADRIILVEKGTWDKDEVMHVGADGSSGSRISAAGSTEVHLTAIDNVVKDEAVTFIKMDVEGAELRSLMGARSTIIKNHPRLAICVYHKSEDLYEIPGYILSLVSEYKFLLRHYCSRDYETVLYAYCD